MHPLLPLKLPKWNNVKRVDVCFSTVVADDNTASDLGNVNYESNEEEQSKLTSDEEYFMQYNTCYNYDIGSNWRIISQGMFGIGVLF